MIPEERGQKGENEEAYFDRRKNRSSHSVVY